MAEAMSLPFTTSEQNRIAWFRRGSIAGAVVATLAGAVMVAAWIFYPPAISGLSPFWMWKANCALCLLLCGIALLAGHRSVAGHGGPDAPSRVRQGLALFVGLFSVLTLVEYATGVRFGLDAILPHDPALKYPGRMSPQTAAMCVLFAVTLLTMHHRDDKGSGIADASLIGGGVLLQSVMSGYLVNGVDVAGVTTATRMAPQSMMVASLVWAALIAARADRGLFSILSSDGRGSYVIRFLLPPAILAPAIIGLLRLWAQSAGLQSSAFSLSVFGTIQGIIRIAAIIGLGYLLNRSESARRAERARREQAERMVAMCAWTQRVRWNDEWVAVDVFLKRRFGIEVTHGISEQALQAQFAALDLADEPTDRPAA
jgi:hypothetical protein